MLKTIIMLGLICLLALIIELDFFIALPKFGAKYFGAPDDLKELVLKIPDKSRVVEIIGLVIMLVAILGVLAVFAWAVMETFQNFQGLMPTFLRFLIILEGYKLFDVACFDWLLLTKIRFPERLYPETRGAKGYDSFGFNAKSQLIKAVVFAVVSFAVAIVFELICK